MNKRISLAIVYNEINGWAQRILTQNGVCLVELSKLDSTCQYPILFYKDNEVLLQDILSENPEFSLVITNHLALSKFLKLNLRTYYSKSYVHESEEIVINQDILAVEVNDEVNEMGWHLDNSGKKIVGSGILIGKHNDVTYLSFPWNFDHLLEKYSELNLNNTFVYKNGFSFSETGVISDFRSVRQIIIAYISKSVRSIGLPFCYVDFKPRGGKYVCLRLDADGFSKLSTEKCLELSEKLGHPFTWFLNVRDVRQDKEQLKLLRNTSQDLQIHGYYHIVFLSFISNYINLLAAKFYLLAKGIKIQGSASPLGLWNKKYNYAMRFTGIKYSSEFTLSTDDIPFYPYNNSSFPLQIPSFNASIGTLGSNQFNDLLELWRHNIDEQLADKGVAIIYDHPLNRLETIVEYVAELLLNLKSLEVKGITMSEYAKLWKSRPVLKSISLNNNEIEYKFKSIAMNEENFSIQVEKPLIRRSEYLKFEELNLGLNSELVEIKLGQNNSLPLQKKSFFSFYLIYLKNRIKHKLHHIKKKNVQ